jgi:hypothetical protein
MSAETPDTAATRLGAELRSADPIGPPPPPRFDRRFIEQHGIVERYLDGKLPRKGASDLENWCRQHPEYLEELKLCDRATASLRLLEATGRPADLSDPKIPWWKTPYVTVGLGVLALAGLIGLLTVYEKYEYVSRKLEDARELATLGSLAPATSQRLVRLEPDHAPGLGQARLTVNRGRPELIDLHLDMGYTRNTEFRLVVDKRDQGRALIVENLLKDSNGDVKLAFNSSGLTPGSYDLRLEGLPPRGSPLAEGWLSIDAH